MRNVFVISDLHLGGEWPQGSSRGFRMMTEPERLASFIHHVAERPASELVINGDFMDFLAEEHEDPTWVPFLYRPEAAAETMQKMVTRSRDREVFAALAEVIRRGNRLTILLGNHDVELALPRARAVLAQALGAEEGRGFRFVYDGEAYSPAPNVIIEHGNRYDPANVVDHDGLRRLRSLQSRGQIEYQGGEYKPPAGSRLVAEVMNPIKAQYGFIDLLKPESEPLFALLLALEPDVRKRIAPLAKILVGTKDHRLREDALPGFMGDISSTEATDAALREVVALAVGADASGALVATQDADAPFAQDVSASSWFMSKLGVVRLLINGDHATVMQRLGMIRQALRALEDDNSFDDHSEVLKRYRRAAEELSKTYDGHRRFDYVVFGHTHHARQVTLTSGATYLNSGTWANLMRFPKAIFDADSAVADDALWRLLEDTRENNLAKYIELRPTYVQLGIDDNRVVEGNLRDYGDSLDR